MYNDIELKFYNIFDIPSTELHPPQDEVCGTRDEMTTFFEEQYPPITDSRLLELIVIHGSYLGHGFYSLSVSSLRNEILNDLTEEMEIRYGDNNYSDDLYRDVRKVMGVCNEQE